jgi:hypothetical protein
MTIVFWQEFGILFAASLVGAAAVLPYSLRLLPKDKPLKFSMSMMFLLSMLQNAVIFAIVTVLGLLAAHAIGLGAPYIKAMLAGTAAPQATGLLIALVLGAIAGGILLVADLLFLPHWPQVLRDTALKTTALENFLASIYGGVNEELLVRFFGFSALSWLILFVLHHTLVVFWISNITTTILFGLGHLPALKNLLGHMPRLMVARSLLLNAPIGLLCGWLFWTYGIEAAIIAHFSADIVYHVFGTAVLRQKLAGPVL